MDPLQQSLRRLAHYGYEVVPFGERWTFNPNGRGALHATREVATERAIGALDVELSRAAFMTQKQRCEPA